MQARIIDTIRETQSQKVGETMHERANKGRSKIVESEGALMQVHPQLFIMEVKRKRGSNARQSYQYVDVLTGMVELYRNGEPIFEGSFIDDGHEDEASAPAVEN
ncbi:MAG: Veg family protein [Coriobacteriia bacterium]|nr:Veg family protein [Coriobacteriia bacterium]